ncbi:MAG: autotransporter-associated beta strand repeat-containing protein, partial [Planctomycetaceae bacterium]
QLACGRVDAANRFWTGDGTWNLTNANWGTATGGPYNNSTWSNTAPDAATFEGTKGTVTLTMTATTSGMTFNTTGYTVTGGAFAMRGGSGLNTATGVTGTIASQVTGPGSITKTGAGVLRLTNTANDFTGTISLSSGVLEMASIPSSNTITFTGGTLRYVGTTNRTSNRPLEIRNSVARLESSGAGTINFSSSSIVASVGLTPAGATLRLGGTNTGDNFWRGRLNNFSEGPAAMAKADGGTWIVTGSSGYTGGTTISGGTLGFGSTTALGTGTVAFSANATLRATVSGTLANTISTGASSAVTAAVDTQANEVTLSGSIDGAGNLTKTGAGTLTLTASNTFTGATTVSAGTVALSGTGSIGTGGLNLGTTTSPGAFDLAALTADTYSLPSTASLSGVGALSGGGKTLAVLGSLAPGNSTGTISVGTGLSLDLSNSGTGVFEITSPLYTPGTFDLVNGGGSVIFGGVLNLNFSGGTYADDTDVLQIFANTGGRSGNFSAVNATGLAAGQSATFNPATGYVSIVPEPSTYAMALAGLAGGFAIRRRRSRADPA